MSAENDSTNASNLPLPAERIAVRSSAPRVGAAFLSQLIAEREQLPPQRARRRATMATAVGSYDAAATIAQRRIPPGYRKTLAV
jgi:hypothetical protein